jgi:hypothetical protein
MTARKSYETAVKAFRAGAADVVLKEPDVVPYLRERVVEAATDIQGDRRPQQPARRRSRRPHEEFLRRLPRRRRARAWTWRIASSGTGSRTSDDDHGTVSVVLGRRRSPRRSRKLAEGDDVRRPGWQLRAALTGGEALDVVPADAPADRDRSRRPARSARAAWSCTR